MSEDAPTYDGERLRRSGHPDRHEELVKHLARDLVEYRDLLIRCSIPEPLLSRLLIVFQVSYLAAVWDQPVVVHIVGTEGLLEGALVSPQTGTGASDQRVAELMRDWLLIHEELEGGE